MNLGKFDDAFQIYLKLVRIPSSCFLPVSGLKDCLTVNADGHVVKGEGIIMPDGEAMKELTILTPKADYDPHRFKTGMLIEKWLRGIGIPVNTNTLEFGTLMTLIKYRHQFDIFVLGYGNLSLDPDYIRSFFHSQNDKPGGWNMSGYKNFFFDKIADESVRTMNLETRRQLIWKMQYIIMHDVPYFPLYNPKMIEDVSSNRFNGWVEMLGGIANVWSFCQIKLQ